ncbi:MAG: PaaI family thioesterase [Mesorhizobium sp.]
MDDVEIFPGYVSRRGIGSLPREDLPKYTGLEMLQRMLDGHYPAPAISQRMNFILSEVGEGRAVFRGLPGARHLNPLGSVHGGWAATILDSALGCSVHTTMAKGEGYSTVEFNVKLARPITVKTGEVICEGRVIQRGRTIAFSEATLRDKDGKLLATGTETCAIFPLDRLAG